jgi:hypothetical protein
MFLESVSGPDKPEDGAGDGTRTRDVQLGKLAFFQLNYSRSASVINIAQSIDYAQSEMARPENLRFYLARARP